MEKLVEAVTLYNYEEFKKLNEFHMRKRRKGPMIFLIVCCAILILASVLLLVYKEYFQGTCYLIFALCMLLFIYVMPSILSKRMKNTEQSENINTTTFYKTYFENSNEQGISKLNYDEIYDAYETNTNFYIYVNSRAAFMISKAGIKSGSETILRKLLQSNLNKKFKIKK